MNKKLKTTFDKWMADPEIKELFDKEEKKFLKAIKTKPKRLNCIATEKCQINFEQE